MKKTKFLFLMVVFGALLSGGCYRYTDGYPNRSLSYGEASLLPFSQTYYNEPDYGPYNPPYPYYAYPYPYPYPYYYPYPYPPYYVYPYWPYYSRFYFGGYYIHPHRGFPSSSPKRTFRSNSPNSSSSNSSAPSKNGRRFR